MTVSIILLLSILSTSVLIVLHFLFINFFALKKTIEIIIPFFFSNLALVYFLISMGLQELIYNTFIINLSVVIIYMQFYNVLKMGFTLAIITLFKKNKLFYKDILNNYGNGKGAKRGFLERLDRLKKLKFIKVNKTISLTKRGELLTVILIICRKIFSVKDFG